MENEIIKWTLALLGSSLVAALSAFLGVRFGLRKIRHETAFERRLVWCEDTMTRLNAAGSAVTQAAQALDLSAEACNQAWSRGLDSYHRLLPYSAQKELYASSKAFKAISEAMVAMEQLLRNYFDGKSDCRNYSPSCIIKLQCAVTELAKEARAHLGFEPLEEALLKPREQFLHFISAPKQPISETRTAHDAGYPIQECSPATQGAKDKDEETEAR